MQVNGIQFQQDNILFFGLYKQENKSNKKKTLKLMNCLGVTGLRLGVWIKFSYYGEDIPIPIFVLLVLSRNNPGRKCGTKGRITWSVPFGKLVHSALWWLLGKNGKAMWRQLACIINFFLFFHVYAHPRFLYTLFRLGN